MRIDSAERRRVLVVDDDQKVLDLLLELLQEQYDVTAAVDGRTALALVFSYKPDVVVSDVVMPGMNGIELCRQLKRDERTTHIPVLLISGIRNSDEDSLEGLTAGADDYLDVPFRHDEFLVKVARLAERHRVEKRYREIVEHAADIIYTRDMEGYLTSMNEAGVKFFGKCVTDLIGTHLSGLMGAEAAATAIELTSHCGSELPLRSTHSIRDALGSERYLEELVTVECDAQNNPIGVRAVVRDITEQKLTEQALKESEARYRQLVELSPEAIAVESGGRFVYVNPAAQKLWGADSAEELIGRPVLDLVHPDYHELVRDRLRLVRDERKASGLVEEKFVRLDGQVIDVEVLSMPFTFRGELAVQAVIRNITERKQVERTLASERILLRTLVDNLPDQIYAKDSTSRFILANASVARAMNVSSHLDLLGKTDFDFAPTELASQYFAAEQAMLQSGEPLLAHEEQAAKNSTGDTRWYWSEKVPLRDSGGEVIGLVGVGRDITAHKRLTEERQIIFDIIQGVITTPNLDELLKLVHHSISKLLYAENCFVALYDPETDFIAFEFWVDKFDPVPSPRPVGNKGFSSYVLRTGKPLLLKDEVIDEMYERGEVEKSGTASASWLGVPLRTASRTIGVLAVQHYEVNDAYSERDLEFLTSVGSQIALAIERKRADEALRQREAQYRRLLDQIPDVAWTADESRNAVFVSERMITLFGYTPAECYRDGRRLWFDSLHPDDQERVQLAYAQLFKENKPYDVEYRMRHRDGQWVWWHDRAVAIYEKDGLRYADGLLSDITERKQAEEALRQSEDGYRELFENANDIIYTHDLNGNFTSLNMAGERITGYSRDEARNLNIGEVVAPEYLALARKMISQKNVASDTSVYELEIIAKDGRRVRLEVSTKLIFRESKAVAIQGIARDLTDRKRSEDALRESQEFFHSFMNNSPAVAFMKDDAGRYVYVNQPFERLLGRKLDFLQGKTSFDWLPESTAKATHDSDMDILLTGRSQEIVEEVPAADGSLHHWLVFKFPMTDNAGRRFVAGVGVDITERRGAQQALAQQAEREGLTHRISQAVRRSLDVSEIFSTAVTELGSHLHVDRCSLYLKNDRENRAVNVAEYHVAGVSPAAKDFDLPAVLRLIQALDQEGVLAFDDAVDNGRIAELTRLPSDGDVRSIMYVAIRVGNEVSAVFVLSTTRAARKWTPADIMIARAVADQTGIAIRQAQLYQKAEATSVREALANSLSLAIRASLSLPEVLKTATHELGRALAASRVYLHLFDLENPISPAQYQYLAPGSASIKQIELSYNDPLGQRLNSDPNPVVINDTQKHDEGSPEFQAQVRTQAEQFGQRSKIYYPLIVNGVFRGTLVINQTDRARYWTEDELALVESVAAQLATGIAQAELFEMVARGKQEWEATFDAMSDGIFIFDRGGRLKRVNRAGANMESSTPQDLLGRRCCDILRTSTEDESCVVEKALAESGSVTIEVTPERLNRPLLVTIEAVPDKSGRPAAVVCTARDLSELRKVQAVAREHQSLLTNILESARESIYALDTQGRFKWCNNATLRGLGYKRDDFIGRHLLEMIFEGDRAEVREKLQAALRGEPQTCEFRYFARDGKLRYTRVDKSPLIVDGRTTGVLGIARDVTEQKEERERAARADKLRALGQLASGVAHDFNNSLAAILGRAQLLHRQTTDPALVRNVEIIQTAAQDAAATVRRIQTFARKSSALEFELVDVRGLLNDAIEITRTRWYNEARLRGLNYEVSLVAATELPANASASELREVFVNLIVNAVDAMPQGGRLAISCARSDEGLKLYFADTGSGMSEDVREKVFEPFFSTKGAHGTGLGLSVSYSIIERHGGSIRVDSEVGRGTTFTIELPGTERGEPCTGDRISAPESLALSILVIDDESTVRETLADMLTILNHKVQLAHSGHVALQKLGTTDFDLVFTDLAMPEMDGWETARAIRQLRPETSIVLVTGYGAGTTPPAGETDLIDAILGKPFDFDQVGEVIRRLFAPEVQKLEPAAMGAESALYL
jgi:PAS domain S-box-containing protein